ncbi:MAG: MBL fold metallo-hydrolase, partial [Microcystis sp.]
GGKIAKACDAYLEILPQFPASVQNFAKHQPLFWDERICPRLRRLPEKPTPLGGTTPIILLIDRLEEVSKYLQGDKPWLMLVPQHLHDINLENPGLKAAQRSRLISQETYLLAEHSDS